MAHFAFMLIMATGIIAQEPGAQPPGDQQPAAQRPTTEELRAAALEWMDDYLRGSMLFRAEDVAKLRAQVEKMTPAELEQWARKTVDVRDIVQSDEWQETEAWMREFLKVQAMYSDEEIEDLRKNAGTMTPEDLIGLLERIEDKHRQLTWMHGVSERNRATSLKATQNEIRSQAASSRPTGGSRPLFGGTKTVNANARYKGKSGASRRGFRGFRGFGRGW